MVTFSEIESSEDSFTLTSSQPRHLLTSNFIDLTTPQTIQAFTAAQYTGLTFYAVDATNAQLLINNQAFQGYVLNISANQTGLNNVTLPAGRWYVGVVDNQALSAGQTVRGFDEISAFTAPGETFIGNVALGVGGNAGAWKVQPFSLSGSPDLHIETEGTGGEFMVMSSAQAQAFEAAYPNGYTGGTYSYLEVFGPQGSALGTELEGSLNLPAGQYALTWINDTGTWAGGAADIIGYAAQGGSQLTTGGGGNPGGGNGGGGGSVSPAVVSTISETPGSGVLSPGQSVQIQIFFTKSITVSGTPTLLLNDGGVASYVSGSGNSFLNFSYTVRSTDISVSQLFVSTINLNGGQITDSSNLSANLSLAGLSQSGPQITVVQPAQISAIVEQPSSGTLYTGQTNTIIVYFNKAVSIIGSPSLLLNDGGIATYSGGSGTTALVFTYTVGAHDTPVPSLVVNAINLNGGAITDTSSRAAGLSVAGLFQAGPQIQVAGAAPTVVAIGEQPATGSLSAGQSDTITVNFSKAVNISGAPTLSLNDGGTAVYSGGSGTTALTFSYTVGAHDVAVSSLVVSAINLNGGAIIDTSNQAATLSLAGLAQAGPQIVVAGPAMLAGITEQPATGSLTAGQSDTITLAFSKAITVSGAPTLTLNDGGTATYSGGSGTTALTFSYTVGAHDVAVSSLAVSAVNLNGGAINDTTSQAAGLTLSGLTQTGPQIVVKSTTPLDPTVIKWVNSILREDAYTGPDAGAVSTLSQGTTTGSIAHPFQTILNLAKSTTSVATLAYEFFTGAAPTPDGMDYLVSPTGPNANNLNAPYYQHFSLENRYINFAVNLGKAGAGNASFSANYGSLSLSDAMTKAYTTIFGATPTATKIDTLLNALVPDGLGGTETRAQYFASYGLDGVTGIGTKAAMVGWLLGEAVKADVGDYALSNDAYLTDVAAGKAIFGINLIANYDNSGFHYLGG